MKIIKQIQFLFQAGLVCMALTGCNKDITEFGFDAALSGTVKDQEGNPVAGNITANNLIVRALGEGDKVPMDLRVDGNGFFQNTKLFPKKFKIYLNGPATLVGDTVRVDFAAEKVVARDLVAVPFITVKKPGIAGTPAATEISVSYDLAANGGKTIAKREVYVSTNPFPDANTGSGPFYTTKTVTLPNNKGTIAVTGLVTKTKYYVRVGAQATGAGYNYSEQITVTTP